MAAAVMLELRCPNDGKLLMKASDVPGLVVEVKCRHCKQTITAEVEPTVDADE